MSTPEHRIRRIAERQHGTITRAQAYAAGFSDDQIRHRVTIGLWQRLDRGTYLLYGQPSPRARLAAAVFALPAVVSHRSAATIHGLAEITASTPEVTVPHRLSNRFAGVDVHESTDLDPDHIERIDSLPVTNVARTIFDIAIGLKKGQLRMSVDDAIVRRLTTPDQLSDVLRSVGRRGRPGTAAMRKLVEDLAIRVSAPESELESRMIHLLQSAGLPTPTLQMRVPWRSAVDGRVDMAFPLQRLIVECDGRRWHTLAESFERDRRRDNLAQAAGWCVLRFTWDDVTKRPRQTVRQIRTLLERAA